MREDNNYEKSNSDPAPISPAANSSHDENEHVDPEALWVKVVPNLQKKFGQHAFNRWFKNSQLALTSSGDWALQVPSETHALWIDTNFVDDLNDALASELHDKNLNSIKVEVASLKTVSEKGPQSGEEQTSTESSLGENELFPDADFSKPGSSEAVHKQRAKQARLNPTNVFDRFVVGGSNEFAHAACLAISQGHGAAYNPLFLHGDSGMGKTHLVQALGHELLKRRPKAKVIYLTCERFTNEFIEAVQKGNLDRFRSNYRKADVLMVDDVQFLSGKEKSGDEFFHTFNALLDLQAQIILTSDRPACEIQTLEPRLVSRFESGLTVALQPPSLEMRIAILQKKMEEWHVNLPNQTLVYIAERVKSNVRRLEGALVRVATYSSLGRGQVDEATVETLLKDIFTEEAGRRVTIDNIQRKVAEFYDLRLADMTSRRRPKNIARARQVAMFLSRRLTQNSLIEIGEAFGGRDHGTIIHACKKVESLLQTEDSFKQTIDLLETKLHR